MTTDAVIGIIEGLLKVLAPIGGGALLLAIAYFTWRTRSAHLLRHQLWKLAHGKDAVKDESVREFIDERTSLMAFIYSSGVSSRTLKQSRALIAWLKKNDEDIKVVRMLGSHFDHETLTVKASAARMTRLEWAWLGLASISLLIALLVGGLFAERGYFTVKESRTDFSVNEVDARSAGLHLWTDRPVLNAEQCRQTPKATGGFDARDAAAICKLLLEPDFTAILARAKRDQKWAAALLDFVLLVWLLLALSNLRRVVCARELLGRLQRRSQSDGLTL